MTIVPDEKDWTWILERACPDRGTDVTTLAPAQIPGAVRSLVTRWPLVLTGPDLALRPRAAPPVGHRRPPEVSGVSAGSSARR